MYLLRRYKISPEPTQSVIPKQSKEDGSIRSIMLYLYKCKKRKKAPRF